MTEPTDEEIERAERIKRLREGEAVPRRGRRRPDPPDGIPEDAADDQSGDRDPASGGADEAEGDSGAADDGGRESADDGTDGASPAPDDLELPPDAPDDLTTASLYLTEDLEERLLRLEEHMDLRHGFRYDGDLEGKRHVRPLAMYLGVRQLDKLDAEEIYALFESIEEVESP